jgi:hypothetical protein
MATVQSQRSDLPAGCPKLILPEESDPKGDAAAPRAEGVDGAGIWGDEGWTVGELAAGSAAFAVPEKAYSHL